MSNIGDGTVIFKLRDSRLDSIIVSVLDTIYPVGSIYITTNSATPFSNLDFGEWSEVSSGRVLQGADSSHSAGSTVEAGLPNITGRVGPIDDMSAKIYEGAFSKGENSAYDATSNHEGGGWILDFDASGSSSIYGNSSTVQPPAYIVHIWKRTA